MPLPLDPHLRSIWRSLDAEMQREQLHSAAQHGDISKVKQLLDRRYPVNRFDDLGKTPLHYAVEGEHFDLVEMLLRAGAKVNAHDERVIGNTPLGDNAGTCSERMARLLIGAGADPTIPGWMQLTAIDRAQVREEPEGRKVLALLRSAAGQGGGKIVS